MQLIFLGGQSKTHLQNVLVTWLQDGKMKPPPTGVRRAPPPATLVHLLTSHPPLETSPSPCPDRGSRSHLAHSQGWGSVSFGVAISITLFFLACSRHMQKSLFNVPAGACHTASGHVTYFLSKLHRSTGRSHVWKLTDKVCSYLSHVHAPAPTSSPISAASDPPHSLCSSG